MIRKLLLLILLAATPLAAQDAQLFIERIEVRNHKRVSPHVVIAESRLHENRAYTEAELRDAATRLSRLPFLLSVDFALEKGSERGRHVLVLTVQETKPFFFLLDGVTYFDDKDPYLDIDYDERPGASDEDLVLGFRWFVGRRGAVHVGFSGVGTDRAFTREYAALSAGYTQYDLFGTRAFATLNVRQPVETGGAGLSPQLVLGVPLSPNQTVTFEYDQTRFERDLRSLAGEPVENRMDQRVLSARWSYNTTNDPFFPTDGTLLTIGPHYGWMDGVDSYWDLPPGAPPRKEVFHSRVYGARAGATRFLELTERSSMWGDVRGEWANLDRRSDHFPEYGHAASSAGIGAGYAFSLWSREERARGGDSRFEVSARYTYRADPEYDSFYFEHEPHVYQGSLAWVRRTSWGTLRLGVGYAW